MLYITLRISLSHNNLLAEKYELHINRLKFFDNLTAIFIAVTELMIVYIYGLHETLFYLTEENSFDSNKVI